MINLSELELRVFTVLNEHNVEYLLIGGCAMRGPGIDLGIAHVLILLKTLETNVEKVWKALLALGQEPQFALSELTRPNKHIRLQREPFDFLTPAAEIDFPALYSSRETTIEQGIPISVMSSRDLLGSKREVL